MTNLRRIVPRRPQNPVCSRRSRVPPEVGSRHVTTVSIGPPFYV